ncbi:MAG: class I SAM-dependent methyltransferase [bacterium]
MYKIDFHEQVSAYYDQDVAFGFEKRAGENALLQRIRDDFRQITIKYPFRDVLEIGCGPGFDVAWFANSYPEARITGIDISPKMVELAHHRLRKQHLSNAEVLVMDERKLQEKFGNASFDLIYVYFGALNTVPDLEETASHIYNLLKPGGHTVLTFVNKWYLREMLVQLLKLNFKTAFARLKREWGGYSPNRHLPSRCYSASQIMKIFRQFNLLEKKGYSIIFPAWYNPQKLKGKPEKMKQLWEKDQQIQGTFLWSKGEYILFVFKRP